MTSTPSNDELEKRIAALEAECSALKQELADSRARDEADALKLKILEMAPTIIAFHDPDHHLVWANAAYEAATGLTVSEMEGRTCYSVWGLNSPCEGCPVITAMEAGKPARAELTTETQTHWPESLGSWLSTAVPVHDKTGKLLGAIESAIDITAQKQAEAAHAAQQGRFQQILDSFPYGIYIVDSEYRIEHVNHSLRKEFGDPGTLKCYTYFHDLDGPCPWCRNDRVFRGETVQWDWYSEKTKRYYELHDIPLHNPDGGISKLEVFHDITERKRAEEELKETSAILKAAMDCSTAGIAIADAPDGRLRYVNPAGLGIRGGTEKEVVEGVGIDKYVESWQILHFDGTPFAEDEVPLTRAVRYGEHCNRHFVIRRPGDEDRVVWANAAPVTDENGEIRAGIVVFTDITDLRRLETQLAQAQRMEAVGRLAGGVAHDYNNALFVILGHIEMAMDQVAPESPIYGDLKEIMRAAEHSRDITQQLLAFSRQQTVSPRVIDINDIVDKMLKILRRLIGEDIDLAWSPRSGLWPVKMDPAQVDQILANLCVNARDAIANIGQITIETKNVTFDAAYCADHAEAQPGDFALLAVSDSGRGMDRETLQYIYEPFFTTKSQGHGTGLGLATVHGIVKQNNGFINVYSEPGKGTTFRIYLPRHLGEAEEIQPAGEETMPLAQGEMVLLVEDDETIMRLGQRMLESLEYTVLTGSSPKAALDVAAGHPAGIDLLVTDVVMPEMNGRELSDHLRGHYPALKTLFMSGYTANVIAHRGVLDRGLNFIQKPFSRRDLAVKVREALDGGG